MPNALVNGARLHYRIDGAAGAPVVMLSNSLMSNHSMWEAQMPALLARFRVLRYDTRGHGESEVTPGPYRIEQLADDAAALIDAAGVGPVHFVGLSMGGMIGQQLALRHPAKLLSLSLCDTASEMPTRAMWNDRIATAREKGIAGLVDGTIKRWFVAGFVEREASTIANVRRMITTTPVEGYMGCAAAVRDMSQTHLLARITTPTQVIVGREDPACTLAQSQVLQREIRGATLHVIDDAAHLANIEKPEAFTRLLVDFISAQAARLGTRRAPAPMSGVLSPVVTPYGADLSVDHARLLTHCRWLLQADVGLAVFGTNSEGNSLSVAERQAALHALVDAGLPAARMMPGTGGCNLPDVVVATREAVQLGCGGVLMLPPFYYKGVSDDGLFAFFSEVIERVADPALRLYLYHIPPVANVPIPVGVIDRLLSSYGPVVAGIKDSGGQWDHTAALIERFSARGFQVFAGSESFLLRTLRAGGAGCISATANINPAAIAALQRHWQAADADQRQAALDGVRGVFARFPMIAAMKQALATATDHEGWRRVRPPLVALPPADQQALAQALREVGFVLSVPSSVTA